MNKAYTKRLRRARKVAALKRARRSGYNAAGQRQNLEQAFVPPQEYAEHRKLVNGLTNWQHHQWFRAGAPTDLESLRKFSTLQKQKA